MTLDNVVFVDSLPKLDLHGFDRDSARVAVNLFIEDNYKMGNEIFAIVHGIGSGIVKNATHEALKHNKRVQEYKTYYYNQGCTLVRISL